MPSREDMEKAITRLDELFPEHSGGLPNVQRLLLATYVPDAVHDYLSQWSPIPTGRRLMSNRDIPNATSILVTYLGSNLMEDSSLRNMILAETIKTDGFNETLRRCKDMGLLEDHEEWEVEKSVIESEINPGRFVRGPGMRGFLAVVGFPPSFEPGKKQEDKTYFSSVPWRTFPPLVEYQEEVASLVREVLDRRLTSQRGTNRGIVALPTGAGKTRVVVDSLLRWYIDADEPPLLFWICRTGELADQAEESIRRTWQRLCFENIANENQRELRLHRLWSDTGWNSGQDDSIFSDPIDPNRGGIAICIIDTLQNISKLSDEEGPHASAFQGLKDPDCVVIDEAHSFETKSVRDTLEAFGVQVRVGREDASKIPIVAITATPWQADQDRERYMHRRFDRILLKGIVDDEEFDRGSVRDQLIKIRGQLVNDNILSKALYRPLDIGTSRIVVRQSDFDDFNNLRDSFLSRLKNDSARNCKIIDDIVDIMEGSNGRWKSMIVYSMSVNHAHAIACELNRRGIHSAAITGKTRLRDRHGIIKEFRTGDIRVLCNHSVLTVGFDAPNTDVIYITRPVYSAIMLEQIVGRGLRGTKFKGTKNCLVVTPQEQLVLESRLGGENIVLAEDEIKARLLIDEEE